MTTRNEPITHVLTFHLTERELEQLHRYGSRYGSGGFQDLIHRILERSIETRILPDQALLGLGGPGTPPT